MPAGPGTRRSARGADRDATLPSPALHWKGLRAAAAVRSAAPHENEHQGMPRGTALQCVVFARASVL